MPWGLAVMEVVRIGSRNGNCKKHCSPRAEMRREKRKAKVICDDKEKNKEMMKSLHISQKY